jgi:hypothetical protein
VQATLSRLAARAARSGCLWRAARRSLLSARHTLSRSADGRSGTVGGVWACAVAPLADVCGPARTQVNETTTETSEDHSCDVAVSGATPGRAYASTSCTDGSIVHCLVDAKTAERSGESGEMIEPEEDP